MELFRPGGRGKDCVRWVLEKGSSARRRERARMHHEVLLATLGCAGDIIIETSQGSLEVAPHITFLTPGKTRPLPLESEDAPLPPLFRQVHVRGLQRRT